MLVPVGGLILGFRLRFGRLSFSRCFFVVIRFALVIAALHRLIALVAGTAAGASVFVVISTS